MTDQNSTNTKTLTVVWVLFSALILTACGGDGGTGPDPPKKTEKITKHLLAKDAESKDNLADLTIISGGDTLEVGVSSYQVRKDKGADSQSFTIAKAKYESETREVSFDADGDVIFTLKKRPEPDPDPDPTETTLTLSTTTKATFMLKRASRKDSVLAKDTKQASAAVPYETDGEVCASATYFKRSCQPLQAKQEKQTLSFSLKRQRVAVSVSVEAEDGSEVDNPTITVGDYTYKSGERSHAFAAKAGTRRVSASAEGFKRQAKEISAEEDQDVSFSLSRIYACNDGVDNDGDGVADEDDSGCVDENGNYDPEDDVERTRVHQRSFPGTKGDTTFISGATGHQEGALTIKDELPADEINASVSITFGLYNVLVSAQQTGEAFALRLETGPSKQELNTVNTTAIAEDDGTDGWKNAVFDVPKEFFKNGSFYQAYVVHAVKVRGLPATEGNDDVIFRTPNRTGSTVIEIEYEPEEVK